MIRPHKKKGAPDFKVTNRGLILGYVENKAIGENSEQGPEIRANRKIQKPVTEHCRHGLCTSFGLIRMASSARPCAIQPISKIGSFGCARIAPMQSVSCCKHFFRRRPKASGVHSRLALALATRGKLLRDNLGQELVRQEREHKEGRLYGLFQIFRDQVFHELTLKEFADAFAQMLAYGLFLARLNSDSVPVTLHNARQYVPGSFRLIRELIDFLTELERDEYRDVRWVVEEVLSIVNGLNLPAIHEDLSFRQRRAISRKVRAAAEEEHRLFERDPFIYFYEDYLKAYDKDTRKSRGVYYTPPPVVNFIVRAVDDILKQVFSIHDGLADHNRVTVLDFACG